MIYLIASIDKNLGIGYKNNLLEKFPEDLLHFRNTTINNVVACGRLTYESIGKPLPKRINIVISGTLQSDQVIVEKSVKSTVEYYKNTYPEKDLFFIGGQSIYEQAIDLSDQLILTNIDKEYQADRFFPSIDAWMPFYSKELSDILTVKVYKRK